MQSPDWVSAPRNSSSGVHCPERGKPAQSIAMCKLWISTTDFSPGSHTVCFTLFTWTFACTKAVQLSFSVPWEAELGTLPWVCELLMNSARGTEICDIWIVGCLSTWMTITFHCHIDSFTYTVKFYQQNDESIFMSQLVSSLGVYDLHCVCRYRCDTAISNDGFPLSVDSKQSDRSNLNHTKVLCSLFQMCQWRVSFMLFVCLTLYVFETLCSCFRMKRGNDVERSKESAWVRNDWRANA